MNKPCFFHFLSLLLIAILFIFNASSCTDGSSFKKASDYNSQLDSTYDYETDSIVYNTPWSIGDSLMLPSPSGFNTAIIIHGYSWWRGYDYRCIISGKKDKKLQMIFRNLSTPDSIYKYEYHEKKLNDDEYNQIARLILKKDIPNFPFDLENGRGKGMIDADTYIVMLKEDEFFKTTFWRVNDSENKEKENAFQVHQAILKLSGYPLPKPYVKLKSSYDGIIDCKVGVYNNGLLIDYEVRYKGELLEKADTVWNYVISVPLSEIKHLKDKLDFVAKFENGEKVNLPDLEIDSSRMVR